MSSEITVVAILKAQPGKEAAVAQAMAACVAPTLTETGNSLYVPNQDLDDPQSFVFVERWASRAALEAHLQTPHFKQLAATLETLLSEPLKVHILQPVPGA